MRRRTHVSNQALFFPLVGLPQGLLQFRIGRNDESVVVEWNGQPLNVNGFRASGTQQWTTITAEVVGTGGRDVVRLMRRV